MTYPISSKKLIFPFNRDNNFLTFFVITEAKDTFFVITEAKDTFFVITEAKDTFFVITEAKDTFFGLLRVLFEDFVLNQLDCGVFNALTRNTCVS